MQVEVESRAFAATWRDEKTGEIVGSTLGNTMCWNPRRPWALTIARDGDQLIAPCGECPGCLEFLRRRLADRLKAKYGGGVVQLGTRAAHTREIAGSNPAPATQPLWLIRIWHPRELQVELSRKLHRRKGLELEPGFYRLGVTSFALLSRSRQKFVELLRRLGLKHHVEPVRLSRGRRAWRTLTAGILVARALYGTQVKRWYARGLPASERLRWEVVRKAMQKPWRRRTGARVRTSSNLILVPPAIWSMGGDRVKQYRAAVSAAISPEEAMANRRRVAELVAGASSGFQLVAPAEPALTREQVQTFYARMKQRIAARASATPDAALNPSTLLGGGLRSSLHSGDGDPAPATAETLAEWLLKGEPRPPNSTTEAYWAWLNERWSDGRTRREIRDTLAQVDREQRKALSHEKFLGELDTWVERMKSKSRGG